MNATDTKMLAASRRREQVDALRDGRKNRAATFKNKSKYDRKAKHTNRRDW